MILLCIALWTLCAVIAYGVVKFIDPREVEGDEASVMLMCFLIWPYFALIGIGYIFFRWLSKFGEFVAGFLSGLLGRKDEDND